MMDFNAKPSQQFIYLQNQAYHEDKLLHSKPKIDNRWKEGTHVNTLENPSKKHYLSKEKHREIETENLRLLSKIYTIIFDKNKEFQKQYNQAPKEGAKENIPKPPSFHPYSNDNKVRSLNIWSRRKETDRINKDNFQLLNKLKHSKPTVITNNEMKEREKAMKHLADKSRRFSSRTPAKIFPSITNRGHHLNPVVENYLKRHDLYPRRELRELNNDINNVQKDLSLDDGLNSVKEGNGAKKPDLDNSMINRPVRRKYKKKQRNESEPPNSRLNKSNIDYVVKEEDTIDSSIDKMSQRGSRNQDRIKNNAEQNYVTDSIEREMKRLENSYMEEPTKEALNKTFN